MTIRDFSLFGFWSALPAPLSHDQSASWPQLMSSIADDIRLPILFVILGASVFFVNDIGRVARFFGHVGFSMEFGYLVGGIVGAWLGWMR